MCFPTNTRPRRIALPDGATTAMQTHPSGALRLNLAFGAATEMKSCNAMMIDKCEPPKRRGSMLTSDCGDAKESQNMIMDLSVVLADSVMFKCDPPRRRESMSSDSTSSTTSVVSTSTFVVAPVQNKTTELVFKCESPKCGDSMNSDYKEDTTASVSPFSFFMVPPVQDKASEFMFKCEPPKRRGSMSSDYTETTASVSSTSSFSVSPVQSNATAFLRRSNSKHLHRLRRHKDVHGGGD